tara:strand:+ start:620 stop:1387 length:768 start_codon:yes stop_codon:yes gene_type:complete
MAIKVGVLGASGRMGSEVCKAVINDPDTALVAAIDENNVGESIASSDLCITDDFSAVQDADVVVDFTVADSVRRNLPKIAESEVHAVVGTTGLTEADIEGLKSLFKGSNCVIAPNFAISAVLMMRFSELAAPHFDNVEIIEYHHSSKVDAPSGTALTTAERIGASSTMRIKNSTDNFILDGARGGVTEDGISIHSVRMEGMVAHQDVIFGTDGQTLTIRQDSYDRSSFMPGVLLAVKNVGNYPGITIGLEPLLNL